MAGCATVKEQYDLAFSGAQKDLSRAARLIGVGAYEEALTISETVLREHRNTMGDQALFQMAVIFADPQNPKQDVRQAVELFGRLTKTYSRSELVVQGKVWMRVLTLQVAAQDQIRQLIQEIDRYAKTVEDQKTEKDRLTDQIAHATRQLELVHEVLVEMQEKNRRLEEQIMQMKDIELDIQQKKEKIQ